jgi:hypothetical protein
LNLRNDGVPDVMMNGNAGFLEGRADALNVGHRFFLCTAAKWAGWGDLFPPL